MDAHSHASLPTTADMADCAMSNIWRVDDDEEESKARWHFRQS